MSASDLAMGKGMAPWRWRMPLNVITNEQLCRVYYSSSEKPEEVWAQLADGSCRWRQTGSEIKIICLKVSLTRPSVFCLLFLAMDLPHRRGLKSCSMRSALLKSVCGQDASVAALV